MARTKLNQAIRGLDGEITTLGKLLDSGKATLHKSDNFRERGGGTRVAYFVDLLNEQGAVGGSFEIGKMAYNSRAKT